MASSVKFVSATGRVNNTPITQCIHCREKTPNPGFPFCNDCRSLVSATQQPCSACKKTMIERIPYTKLTRLFCSPCNEKHVAKKKENQVKIAIPETPVNHDDSYHRNTYAEPEKQRLFEMFEGLSHLQIVNIVYDMLEQKEQFIQETLNDNDLLKAQLAHLSE
jgi:hypothetical protein